ncbi:MAG: hypothetical protein ACM3WQ_00400 [Chloroflexota bacterium]
MAVLIVMVTLSLAIPILPVLAQVGSKIEQIFPSEKVGVVEQAVSVLGSIDTRNGKYELYFGSSVVMSGTAQDNSISANFRIPEVPAGTYAITLRDVATNSNATDSFKVNIAYSVVPAIPAIPEQLQEGSIVALNVSVTGGQPNTPYSANIMVMVPAPLNTNYSHVVTLPTSNANGTTTIQINFPDVAFTPTGSLTDYAGTYNVYYNVSQSLAWSQFTIGFTSLSQYHRGQTVRIRAIGYQTNDTTTITIKNQDSGATFHSADINPTSNGTVIDTWIIPPNAPIGAYQVAVTPRNSPKPVPDSQNITIPGYPVTIQIMDLSSRSVSQISMEALDIATNKTYTGTSDAGGNTTIYLESGRHILTAFWNGLQVGETSINVTETGEFKFQTELGDIKITVKDQNGLLIPSVNLAISYSYMGTKNNQQQTGSEIGQTDANGVFSLNSTPPGISYVIDASVYGIIFNSDNNTVSNLPVKAVSEVTIICPPRTLTFKITDYTGAPIPNARLSLLESNAGIFYSFYTEDGGSATMNITFGRYNTKVYTGSILLNTTVVDAFVDKEVNVQCVIYNLQITVQVVDFFGQAILNANLRLLEADGTILTATTVTNGIATFDKVIGGDMQIVAYLSEDDAYYEARNINVESPTTVQISMGRYVALGMLLVQTNVFITLLIVLPAIIIFLIVEFYTRRRKLKKPNMLTGKIALK